MAVAPYTPFPTEQPYLRPTPMVRLDVPGAAFGENIGAALSHLGSSVEDAGKELFSRATALQELRNEADARAAQADFANQSSQLHANFSSLKGKQAVDAYPKYEQDNNELRTKIRGTLTTPDAQRLFDAESMPFLQRNIFNGAGYAATENKQYLKSSIDANLQANRDQALNNPNDDINFQNMRNRIPELVGQKADIDGLSDDAKNFLISKETSALTLERLKGIARTRVTDAPQFLRDSINDGSLRGEDIDAAVKVTRGEVYTSGARNTISSLRNGSDVLLGSQKVSPTRAMDAIKGVEGGDYSADKAPYTTGKHAGEHYLGAYQISEKNLPDWLKEAGMAPMTNAEFLNDRAAQDKLFGFKFGQFMDKYGTFNDAASMWFSNQPMSAGVNSGVSDGHYNVAQYIQAANARLYKTAKEDDIASAAEKRGNEIGQQGYGLDEAGDYFRTRAIADYGRERQMRREEDFAAKDGIAQLLQAGQYKTIDDIEKTPQGVALLEKLPEQYKLRLPSIINNYNAARTREVSNENLHNLYGMYQDPDRRDEFMAVDPTDPKYQLNEPSIKMIWGLQRQLHKEGQSDPKLDQAYREIYTTMPNSVPTKQADPEGYNNFRGALMQAIMAYQDTYQKHPDPNTVQEIGKQLVKQVAAKGWFGHETTTPFFSASVPNDYVESAKKEYPGISDDQIRSLYNYQRSKQMFEDLYGRNKRPAGGTTKATTPASVSPATGKQPANPAPVSSDNVGNL